MLEQLRQEYLQRLPHRFGELQALWELLRQGDLTVLANLHRMAHSLAGSAGSYGFGKIGQIARLVERTLEGRQAVADLDTPVIEHLLEELRAEIQAAAQTVVVGMDHPSAMMPPLKVLIADDDHASAHLLEALMKSLGHQTCVAADGKMAVALFQQEHPDLVLMDVIMPEMDGMEATRQIKALAGDTFVPIIFLTGMTDNISLISCLEAGGDDFVPKPFTSGVLKAKLLAMNRIRLLHADLARYRRETAAEIEYARHIMRAVTRPNIQLPWLQNWQQACGEFSGDVILLERAANGAVYAFLGDMTGHGLAAALGAVPLADVFYDLAVADRGVGTIAAEANRRLKALLPVNMFCAACILRLDPTLEELRVWSGGVPSLVVWQEDGQLQQITSQQLALSILPAEEFDATEMVLDIRAVRAVIQISDGFTEAENSRGEMFGEQNLLAAIAGSQGRLIENIREKSQEFVGKNGFRDDIALLVADLRQARGR